KYIFKHSYLTCQMLFDYYINNKNHSNAGQIQVMAGNTKDSLVMKGDFRNNSDYWQHATVYLGSYSSDFVVEFIGSSFRSEHVLAIDNINFTGCAIPAGLSKGQFCPGQQVICPITRVCIDQSELCDFEDNCGDNWDEGFSMC